jgi:phosphonate transport system substrate-binding protein
MDMPTSSLSFGSCMAPNADGFITDLLAELEARTGIHVHPVQDRSWPERETGLDLGQIDLGWICGLPYVWKADHPNPPIQLLAAPVMRGEHYDGQPVYFSDVVVRADSRLRTFEDLEGRSWGYNEARSHSGYNLVRYELVRRGLDGSFFGRVIQAGSHERALELILAGEIEAAAIDSTVLETELAMQPSLASRIRIVEVLGPSPIPPFVASKRLPGDHFATIQACLVEMHATRSGQAVLTKHRISHLQLVDDHFYDRIREMARFAEGVALFPDL